MPVVVGVIPARLNSKRFPAKALLPLHGKPLLYYVWRQARRVRSLDRLIIATDSKKIAREAREFGAEIVMTSKRPRNGSERTAEVAQKIPGDIFVNIQADNLVFSPAWIERALAAIISNRREKFHTLVTQITDEADLADPSRVKVALIKTDYGKAASWFTRAAAPYTRDAKNGRDCIGTRCYKHIGIYLYRRSGLKLYQSWPMGTYEKAESLEQLRILEQGQRIGVTVVRGKSIEIDSARDIRRASRGQSKLGAKFA